MVVLQRHHWMMERQGNLIGGPKLLVEHFTPVFRYNGDYAAVVYKD
jgi:hypothetical protein